MEIDLEPRCDDHTLLPDCPLVQWYKYLVEATQNVSRPIQYNLNTRELLHMAGFIDIQETRIRIPLNSWPNDPHEKEIGRWYNLGLTEGLEALSLAPFSRVFQWNVRHHIRPLLEAARAQICNKKIHAYNHMYVSL